jgi:hypothetical protein
MTDIIKGSIIIALAIIVAGFLIGFLNGGIYERLNDICEMNKFTGDVRGSCASYQSFRR